jgi:aspartyl-tRNA(Asn)/glutamyl-tRNA(Gln) amidotransferase subunit C
MSHQIDEAEVRKVALLARLDLTDAEIREFTGQLGAILEYVHKMDKLNTDAVEPLAHCLPVHNSFRADEVRLSLSNDAALANAPERDGEFFTVPKILEDGGAV